MPELTLHDLELPGCSPEPLMNYLKALGVLRLVSGQKDKSARGWWRNETFFLRSPVLFEQKRTDSEKRDALAVFFLEQYAPTPIVAPWGGRSGFYSGPSEKGARRALDAISGSKAPRLQPFRKTIVAVRILLTTLGMDEKATDEKKLELLRYCRSQFADELLPWFDACVVLTGDGRKFPPLLGTGGNEGSGSYVSGFAQLAVACILERRHDSALRCSLFAESAPGILVAQTPGHFSPSAAGGANATEGFEADSRTNPWDYLLCLEGTCMWASAAVRRLGVSQRRMPSFPFTVSVSGGGSATLVVADANKPKQAKRDVAEMWLPVWDRALLLPELSALLSEGRATVSSGAGIRTAENGVDFARALNGLGVDRGIRRFARTAFLMRNGQSFLSIPLGVFDVRERYQVDLLREADAWLQSVRHAARSLKTSTRISSVLHRLDTAMFDFCKYGGTALFQNILRAFGGAERALAFTIGKVGEREVRPLTGLSGDWVNAADDGSVEFTVARALASIYDPARKIGPIRVYLEPVDWKNRFRSWAERELAVVWSAADLATNLFRVLDRRLMDGDRLGCERLPLASHHTLPLDVISAFIWGEVDDARIEDLIWGLMLVTGESDAPAPPPTHEAPPLLREYALLKLLFLPRPLIAELHGDRLRWRLAHHDERGTVIRPELRIVQLLRAGRLGEACRLAAQRLRSSGLSPIPASLPNGKTRDHTWSEQALSQWQAHRLAAALLLPISSRAAGYLVELTCRQQNAAAEALAIASEGGVND